MRESEPGTLTRKRDKTTNYYLLDNVALLFFLKCSSLIKITSSVNNIKDSVDFSLTFVANYSNDTEPQHTPLRPSLAYINTIFPMKIDENLALSHLISP